jgi:uncharacterized membrane protein YfcA
MTWPLLCLIALIIGLYVGAKFGHRVGKTEQGPT